MGKLKAYYFFQVLVVARMSLSSFAERYGLHVKEAMEIDRCFSLSVSDSVSASVCPVSYTHLTLPTKIGV